MQTLAGQEEVTKHRYIMWSIASGSCWGLVALAVIAIAGIDLNRTYAGVIAAPLIGLVVGVVVRRSHSWWLGVKLPVYVMSLVLGTALFGLASGIPLMFDSSFQQPVLPMVLSISASFVVGIFLYPFWIVLIPLAIINNYLLGRIDNESEYRKEGAS
jgi:hypothetical protein